MIRAECHSDDRAIEIEFDAAEWFAQADDQSIRDLAACQWGGDYPADAVADYFSDTATADLFCYLAIRQRARMRQTVGFECNVVESEAMEWLAEHRRALHDELAELAEP